MSDLFSLFRGDLRQGSSVVSPPQSLDSLSEDSSDQEFFLRKIKNFEEVSPKVDYSDYSNFVFFNSAVDYFNITGEKILNEFPFDGSRENIQAYLDDLDDYQRYVVSVWPSRIGHLRFNPSVSSSYVSIEDVGIEDNVQKTGLLSVGTGSWTVEAWCIPPPALTGTEDVMVLFQKTGSLGDGYTAFFSGSRIHFRVSSGSSTDEVSGQYNSGQTSYYSFVFDRQSATSSLSLVTGSSYEFPVVVSSVPVTVTGTLYMGVGGTFLGSGSITGKIVRPFTGSIDDFRVWKIARSLSSLSSSFNAKIFSQENLVALWRFNESGSVLNDQAKNSIVWDHSGHKINGRIIDYFDAIRGSGSLLPYDQRDLILDFDSSDVQFFVLEQQNSGTVYDRTNDNIVTRLIPAEFFKLEQFKNTDVLEKFLYILARQFDFLKVRIDQFVHVLKTNYTRYDQAPDALLVDVARFFGWEFTGNFLSADAFQYILGKNVLGNLESNKELEMKLFEIKNEFWRRTLNNLMHLYKTKGTRESIESLLRVYGVNKNFVRLKEYGYKPYGALGTFRIAAEKSVYALGFGSGSLTGSLSSSFFSASLRTLETRVRFPLTSSIDIQSTSLSGNIWYVLSSSVSGGVTVNTLSYLKNSLNSFSGALILSGSNFYVSMSAPVFDNRWYNVAAVMDDVSGTVSLSARSIDDGSIDRTHTGSVTANLTASGVYKFVVGASGSFGSQLWMQEARFWERALDVSEIEDHALNYQSYGTKNPGSDNSKIVVHWRLDENVTGSIFATDISTTNNHGTGFGFSSSVNPYKKFLNEYNYVASPEFGWNEEKIRIVDSTIVSPGDSFSENRLAALEFNMIDALNEDISQMLSEMALFNNAIGIPANRYRDSYPDVDNLRRLYFKRLTGRLNFRVFSDMLEFFDNSFVSMVRKLVPASVRFLGDEFVIESHMLERPKLQWNYRRQQKVLEVEGVIKVYLRD